MMASILIVDEQPHVREFLSDQLRSEGYRFAAADDGKSVRGHLRNSQPDLVILDLYPDRPEAKEVLLDIMRQDPDLPVIIFTAYDGYVADSQSPQADGYAIKILALDGLKRKVADVLSRKDEVFERNRDLTLPQQSSQINVT
ncbi:MAG: response regulator [Deltaproteobacteria bacterium]|nr:response regulator [Deltaproteobacteria bacterium]